MSSSASKNPNQNIWTRRLEEVKRHRETEVVGRGEFPAVWEHVESKFPRLAECLRATTVYKNTNTAFCKRIGIPPEAGGMFVVQASTIVLFHTKRIPTDAVLVHEMLHYASQMMGSRFQDEAYEEDFAYQESIPYLLQVGYEPDWIAEKFLLPYYLHLAMIREVAQRSKTTISKAAHRRLRRSSLEKCKDVVSKRLGDIEAKTNGSDDTQGRFASL